MSHKNIVSTSCGPVKGLKQKSCFGDEYYSFQKIPYAAPPIGSLRFRDPQPPEPWKEPLDGTSEGPVAYSFNNYVYSVVGNENCLHLNIFTKNVSCNTGSDWALFAVSNFLLFQLHSKSPAAVMVWIHGGAFVRGSGSAQIYGPDFLLQKHVVLVTFNYRLGALGFLSLKDPALRVPGNAGLRDQLMAIKWVKENVANFGGDPNNITLFGESAGAASVHYHMNNEHSRGLFHKAILMSGCIYNNWALAPDKNWAQRLGAKLGLETDDEAALLAFLQKVEPEQLVLAQEKLLTEEEKLDQTMAATIPMVESYASEQGFIVGDPLKAAKKAWGNEIDILIGGCSNEGLLWFKEVNQKSLEKHASLEHFVPFEIRAAKPADQKSAAESLLNFYFQGKPPSMDHFDEFITVSRRPIEPTFPIFHFFPAPRRLQFLAWLSSRTNCPPQVCQHR